MMKRARIAEIARIGEMTIFETGDLEARTMRLIYCREDNSWWVSDLSPEDMVDQLRSRLTS